MIDKNKIILPIATPLCRTYAPDSFLQSIALNNSNALDWFMNMNINVTAFYYEKPNYQSVPKIHFIPYCNPYTIRYPGNAWDICPMIEKNTISRILIAHENIVEYLIDKLHKGYYIYLFLDQSFRSKQAGNTGFIHQNMIYGFNKEKKIFNIADHFDTGKYSFMEVGFHTVEQAYKHVNSYITDNRNTILDGMPDIFLIALKQYDYIFKINLVKEFTIDFLESKSSFGNLNYMSRNDFIKEYYYGLDMYEIIIRYIDNVINQHIFMWTDWKPFTVLIDHKNLMKIRLDYLERNKYIEYNAKLNDKLNELIYECNAVLNMFIKYITDRDIDRLKRIKVKICYICECDKIFMSELLEALMKY